MTTISDKSTSTLPTRKDVIGWKEELERLKEEESAMKARHTAEEKVIRDRCTKLEKFVEYGMALAEMDAFPESKPVTEEVHKVAPRPEPRLGTSSRRRKGGKTWTATIKRIVAESDHPMTFSEVKDEVAKTHLGETLSRTDKAFYGGIAKLYERGDIIKHRGHLFFPKAFKQFMDDVNAGRVEDVSEPSGSYGGPSPNEIAIERFLENRPNGATTSEIVSNLLNNPPAGLEVTKNRNSIYNLLSRQGKSGKLIRRGDHYFLPCQENETPSENQSEGVSRTDEVSPSSNESRDLLG